MAVSLLTEEAGLEAEFARANQVKSILRNLGRQIIVDIFGPDQAVSDHACETLILQAIQADPTLQSLVDGIDPWNSTTFQKWPEVEARLRKHAQPQQGITGVRTMIGRALKK